MCSASVVCVLVCACVYVCKLYVQQSWASNYFLLHVSDIVVTLSKSLYIHCYSCRMVTWFSAGVAKRAKKKEKKLVHLTVAKLVIWGPGWTIGAIHQKFLARKKNVK